MKIQLDTEHKTIKLEEVVKVGELVTLLESFFPDGAWKEYTLELTIIQNWINPIDIPYIPQQPNYPWWQPTVAPIVPYDNTNPLPYTVTYCTGVYNLDFKK